MNPVSDEVDELARRAGWPRDTLERVAKLLQILVGIRNNAFTRDRLVLKGGTAINLFVLDVPRLSVDIDLNYVGDAVGSGLVEERRSIEQALRRLLRDAGVPRVDVPKSEHALLRVTGSFRSSLRQGLQVKVEVNWMHRVPLWDTQRLASRALPTAGATEIRVADLHELVAGKVVALLDRAMPRDVFDASELLGRGDLVAGRLRAGVVALSVCTKSLDLRRREPRFGPPNTEAMRVSLGPVLGARGPQSAAAWGEAVSGWYERCARGLSVVLPVAGREREFLDRLLDHGEVRPDVLTDDAELASRIARHPGVLWRAENVRRHLLGG